MGEESSAPARENATQTTHRSEIAPRGFNLGTHSRSRRTSSRAYRGRTRVRRVARARVRDRRARGRRDH